MFEQLVQDLPLNQSFDLIYEFIKTFGSDLTSLKMLVVDKTSLKSNHYWIMAILPKLKNLKHLTIYMGKDEYKIATDFF